MKTNWKYSTLSEVEKLKKIRNGDKELFDSEMANTANYASLLGKNGLDNSSAVNYMKQLARALNPKGMFTSLAKSDDVSLQTESGKTQDSTPIEILSGNSGTASASKAVFPKYASGSNGRELDRAMNDYTKALGNYMRSSSELDEENDRLTAYLSEWLINNGYSLDGSLGKKKLGKIENDYEAQKKALKKEYKAASGSALKFLGLKDIIK